MFLQISTDFTPTPGIPPPPLPDSSRAVSRAVPRLSRGIFTPNLHNSLRALLRPVIPINARALRITAAAGTELAGASFGGTVNAWLIGAIRFSSLLTEVYDPKTFIPHAASLRQTFVHCAIFPTAASRRSLDRVSVPVWPVILLDRLPIVALVGRYLTNQLMGRGLIPRGSFHEEASFPPSNNWGSLSGISCRFQQLSRTRGQIIHALLTRAPLYSGAEAPFRVRLACVKARRQRSI